jgi:hypothetical protein
MTLRQLQNRVAAMGSMRASPRPRGDTVAFSATAIRSPFQRRRYCRLPGDVDTVAFPATTMLSPSRRQRYCRLPGDVDTVVFLATRIRSPFRRRRCCRRLGDGATGRLQSDGGPGGSNADHARPPACRQVQPVTPVSARRLGSVLRHVGDRWRCVVGRRRHIGDGWRGHNDTGAGAT